MIPGSAVRSAIENCGIRLYLTVHFSHLCSVKFNRSDTQTLLGVFIVQKCVLVCYHCKNRYRGIKQCNSPF